MSLSGKEKGLLIAIFLRATFQSILNTILELNVKQTAN